MPTYEYRCKKCDETVEYQLTVEEKDGFEPKCPKCGEEMKQVYSPALFIMTGSG